MIKLQTENLEAINKQNKDNGLDVSSISNETAKKELKKIQKSIKEKNIDTHSNINKYTHKNEIKELTKKTKGNYKHILIIGMGGSSLGTIFLKDSLLHKSYNQKSKPSIHIIDYTDPDTIAETIEKIDLSKTLTITISKSGTTLETIAIYQYIKSLAKKEYKNYKKNFIFITENDSKLKKYAEKENQLTLPVPKEVGGRFSILTPVSLFPAKLIGIKIKEIINGAKTQAEELKTSNPSKNTAYQFAKIQYELLKKGKSINVIWAYSKKLQQLSNWYRQLLAESIGKKLNINNKEIFTGITPVLASGTTDQHSQTQLYNEGPNDKLIIFIKTKFKNTLKIKNTEQHEKALLNLENKTLNQIIDISQTATSDALTKNNRPNITIEIEKIDEKTIGKLIIFLETSIIYLGEMLKINAFNQPGVELAKKLIKEKLNF